VTVVDATATQQKPAGRYMSPQRKRQLLIDLAVGETPMRSLAEKYGRTYQYIRRVASENKAEIEALAAEITEKERDLIWASDRFARNLERVTDLVRIEGQLAKLEEEGPASDLWLRLLKVKHQILRQIAEDYGQLPKRLTAFQLGLLPDPNRPPVVRIPEGTDPGFLAAWEWIRDQRGT
jgi:hypothetical protein